MEQELVGIHPESFRRAHKAGAFLLDTFKVYGQRPIALIVGSGWDQALDMEYDSCCNLHVIPGLEPFKTYPEPMGYLRTIRLFMLHETPIYVLSRVNPQNGPVVEGYSLPRLVTEMLFHAGVRDVVCLGSFGSLVEPLLPGDLCVVREFMNCRGYPVPYFPGDRKTNASAALDKSLVEYAKACTEVYPTRPVAHYIVHGSQTESLADKRIMAGDGAHVVGNSGQLDAWLTSIYNEWGASFLMLGVVTTAYGKDFCRETQEDVTKKFGPRMKEWLKDFLTYFPRRKGDDPNESDFEDEAESSEDAEIDLAITRCDTRQC